MILLHKSLKLWLACQENGGQRGDWDLVRHSLRNGSRRLLISLKTAALQGEWNVSNYSGVFFGRTLSRDAVDRARREERNNAIAVK
jgi:hypothetical protein